VFALPLTATAAGDVNGDGYNDLIVGVPFYSASGLSVEGGAYVLFGYSNSTAFPHVDLLTFAPSNSAGFAIFGTVPGAWAGYSVGSARDVNGDGAGDVIVGAIAASSLAEIFGGAAYVVYGSLAPRTNPSALSTTRPTASPSSSAPVASILLGNLVPGLAGHRSALGPTVRCANSAAFLCPNKQTLIAAKRGTYGPTKQ
jgi:hypothetical protein